MAKAVESQGVRVGSGNEVGDLDDEIKRCKLLDVDLTKNVFVIL